MSDWVEEEDGMRCCMLCDVTGVCPDCQGAGKVRRGWCHLCQGSGLCPNCEGRPEL